MSAKSIFPAKTVSVKPSFWCTSIFFSQEKDVAREKIGLSELAITNAVGSPHTDTYFRQIRTRILNNLSHEEIFGVSYVNFKSALELKHSVRRYYKVQ